MKLEKLQSLRCPSCNSELKFEEKKAIQFGFCKKIECKKIWMFSKNANKRFFAFECYDKNFLIEFNIELPFNLGLPTGRYSFDKPNQIMIRRDMYYFQKGNELENLRTMQPMYTGTEAIFDEFGIFKEDFKDFSYKRKLKSVFFKKYPVSGIFRKDLEINKILESGVINDVIFKTQVQFLQDINKFLMYYSTFFPQNNMVGLFQHEIRPISIYEFNKCLFNCAVIIDGNHYNIRPIIQDFTNLKGIPDITYTNHNKKIDEFEKLLKNIGQVQIFTHQQLFILARSLFRTNKHYMGATIITTAVTSYEALLRQLEKHHSYFMRLKDVRKNLFQTQQKLKKSSGKRNFNFLEFYTAYAHISILRFIKNVYGNNFKNNSSKGF